MPLGAAVIVNEVLVNEPGSVAALEWVELYNDGESAVGLVFFEIEISSGSGSSAYALSGTIGAGQYLIISPDTARFRQEWGDDPYVSGSVIQVPIGLANGSGKVALYRIEALQSTFLWDDAGADGVSWERVGAKSDSIAPSLDPRGATPGEVNSNAPVAVDLAFDEVEARADNGSTIIAFEIINRSVSQITDGILELYYYDASASDHLGDWIAAEPIGPIDSAYSLILIGRYQLPGDYQQLSALILISGDLRTYDNRIDFVAPGAEFPPLQLSEFLANPTDGLNSEWVEIKNIASEPVDLWDWQLGDSSGLSLVSPSSLAIGPGEYLVLAQDSSSFKSYYSGFTGQCHQPPSWRALNNDSDSVRLVDAFGHSVDRFYYEGVFESNHTWGRGESDDNRNRWGSSIAVGGTPGAPNEVRFAGEAGESLEILIEPRIFSPDGNGFQDTTVITVIPSEANSYTLKIYDSKGRLVRTFEDGAPGLAENYVWDGRADGGDRLPIGIYILFVEAEGVESAKKTLVIAR